MSQPAPKVIKVRDAEGDTWTRRCGFWSLDTTQPLPCGQIQLDLAILATTYGPLTPVEWATSNGIRAQVTDDDLRALIEREA